MILHTIMPQNMIFPDEVPPSELVCIKEGYAECIRDPSGSMIINRIISTDPQAYLNPRYSPGSIYRR